MFLHTRDRFRNFKIERFFKHFDFFFKHWNNLNSYKNLWIALIISSFPIFIKILLYKTHNTIFNLSIIKNWYQDNFFYNMYI